MIDATADECWRIVDTHQHFQALTTASYPWLDPEERPEPLERDLSPIRRDYRPADYRRHVAGLGILKTVHVQNGHPLDETRWLSNLAEREGMPDAIVAFADLADPEVGRLLEAHAAFPRVRGIRQILNWRDDPRLRSTSSANLKSSGRSGFRQMDMALALARVFPNTTIVLDHLGMLADGSPDAIKNWRVAHIDRYLNPLDVDTGGLGRLFVSTDSNDLLAQRREPHQ